jgi:ParB family chromosome partitioning protein
MRCVATLDLDSLDLLGTAPAAGRPIWIALASIDEDPLQPRREFDAEALRQLAATIARVGVRQPVSVRVHPTQVGRYVLNFGARRLRASKLAGKASIPAFVDDLLDTYDQVIENEQREPLTPMELAIFVQRQLQAGQSRLEIASAMGKSPQYVTYATALIDAPDWLTALYRSGRCRGMLELHELRRLHERHPASVDAWLAKGEAITRAALQRLKTGVAASGDAASPQAPVSAGASRASTGHRRTLMGMPAPTPLSVQLDAASTSARASAAASGSVDAAAIEQRGNALLAAVQALVEEARLADRPAALALREFLERLSALTASLSSSSD